MAKADYTLTKEGSYKSTSYKDPKDIYLDGYWSHDKGHSTVEEQVANVLDKNALVKPWLSNSSSLNVLEIACAPGVLLRDLEGLGYVAYGIEVDRRYAEQINKFANIGGRLHFGFFPDVTKSWEGGMFGNVIALDVIEHVEDGAAFLEECCRLLCVGGHLVIQAPIILGDGEMDEKMFHEIEHIWVYCLDHIRNLLDSVGFSVIDVSRWKVGHEQIVAVKL